MNLQRYLKLLWKISSAIGRLVGKWTYLLTMLILRYRLVKRFSSSSVLADKSVASGREFCPVCGTREHGPFFSFPLGWPEGQNHALLYFDYGSNDMDALWKVRPILDRLLGFFVQTPWSFCRKCQNAFLNVEFSPEHLDTYYSRIYRRSRAIHPLRAATKELHGRYLDALLAPGSTILEVGAAEGFTAKYLADAGHQVFAAELSADHAEKLRDLSGVKYVEDPSLLPQGTFDCVYSHHVLEHVFDPREFVQGLMGLLRDDGLFFVQVPDVSSQAGIYMKYLRRSPLNLVNPYRLDLDVGDYRFADATGVFPWFEALLNDHVIAYTPEGLGNLLRGCGLRVENITLTQLSDVTIDPAVYAWPVDTNTGNTPNSLTAVARKL